MEYMQCGLNQAKRLWDAGRTHESLAVLEHAAEVSMQQVRSLPPVTWWDLERRSFSPASDAEADQAVNFYRVLIRQSPTEAWFHLALGAALESLGKWSEADACVREAVRLEPDDAEVHAEAALILLNTPGHASVDYAFELAVTAHKMQPHNKKHLEALGLAHYRVGNWKSAIDLLQKAIDLTNSGGHPFHYFILAMAYNRLGDKSQAQLFYNLGNRYIEVARKSDDRELLHWRREAAEVLGIDNVNNGDLAPNESTLDPTAQSESPAEVHVKNHQSNTP